MAHIKGVTISSRSGPVFPTMKHRQNGNAMAQAFIYTHTAIAIRPINVCLAEGKVKSFKFCVRLSTPILSFLFIV